MTKFDKYQEALKENRELKRKLKNIKKNIMLITKYNKNYNSKIVKCFSCEKLVIKPISERARNRQDKIFELIKKHKGIIYKKDIYNKYIKKNPVSRRYFNELVSLLEMRGLIKQNFGLGKFVGRRKTILELDK